MDEEYVDRRPGDLETYRRLDAFAQLRLAPDAAAMARIRSSLVAEATRAADVRAAQALVAPTPAPPAIARARRFGLPRRRMSRTVGALLAATLTLGLVAGTVAAARAGGALYEARLWIETVLLPSDPGQRADAQVARLDERLSEVRAAMAGGDAGAMTAALDAYAAILSELESQGMSNEAVADQVIDDVERHQAVLKALVGRVPAQAQDALRHALERSSSAADHLDDRGAGGPGNPGAGGQGSGGSGGSGGDPDRTPSAGTPTAKPTRTPKPVSEPTAKPTKTPPAAEPTKKPPKTPPPPAGPPTEHPGGQPQQSSKAKPTT